jgi:hypothetical protein
VATYTDPTTIVSTGNSEPVAPAIKIILIGSILTVLVAGFFYWEVMAARREAGNLNLAIAQLETELASLDKQANDIQRLATQAEGLKSIFSAQKRWPEVMNFFAQRLHKNMTVTSLLMVDSGQVTLSGTVPDYETYAKVYQAFTDCKGQKYFSSVRPLTVARSTEANGALSHVSFSFNLALQPFVLQRGSYAEYLNPRDPERDPFEECNKS